MFSRLSVEFAGCLIPIAYNKTTAQTEFRNYGKPRELKIFDRSKYRVVTDSSARCLLCRDEGCAIARESMAIVFIETRRNLTEARYSGERGVHLSVLCYYSIKRRIAPCASARIDCGANPTALFFSRTLRIYPNNNERERERHTYVLYVPRARERHLADI